MGNSQAKQRRELPPGLENIGMSGYMNPVLQCMASLPPVAKHFVAGRKKKNAKSVADTFANVMRDLLDDCGKDMVPMADFCRAMGRRKAWFDGLTPQDAHEFFNALVHMLAENTAVGKMFDGKLEWPCTCASCGHVSMTGEEDFMDLSVDLPRRDDPCTVTTCLEYFFSAEKLTGDNVVRCPGCNEYREATKQLAITRFPAVLVVHLKRIKYDEDINRMVMKNNPVDYEICGLDLGPFMAKGGDMCGRSGMYDLCGAVVYSGDNRPDSGRFWAICPHKGQWYRFDDEDVVLDPTGVPQRATDVYVLFYCAKELTQ